MRPQIPETVAREIKEIYREAGYGSESELVRDAVRRRVSELRDDLDSFRRPLSPNFTFDVERINDEIIELVLYPSDHSIYEFGDSGGEHESIPTMFTEKSEITNDTIRPPLEKISGVKRAEITHKGEIHVRFHLNSHENLQESVTRVFETIQSVVREEEDTVTAVRNAAAKHAVPKAAGRDE